MEKNNQEKKIIPPSSDNHYWYVGVFPSGLLFYACVYNVRSFPGCSCNAGDLLSVPGWARSPGEGKGNALQYSFFFFFLHSNILAWKIPWAKETGGLQSIGWQEADMTKELHNNNTV